MPHRDPPPRIPRTRPEERTDAARQIIDMWSGPGRLKVDENHVLTTFAQHTDLTLPFLAFNRYLLMESTLPVRLRQLAIMRAAWLKKGRYVWSSHLRTSLRNGFSGDEFEPLKQGPEAPCWNDEERTVLRATDQVVADSDLDDEHWQALSQYLNRKQVMDFLFTVGAYVLLVMATNPMRIEREEALIELAEQYGAPDPVHDQ